MARFWQFGSRSETAAVVAAVAGAGAAVAGAGVAWRRRGGAGVSCVARVASCSRSAVTQRRATNASAIVVRGPCRVGLARTVHRILLPSCKCRSNASACSSRDVRPARRGGTGSTELRGSIRREHELEVLAASARLVSGISRRRRAPGRTPGTAARRGGGRRPPSVSSFTPSSLHGRGSSPAIRVDQNLPSTIAPSLPTRWTRRWYGW